MERIVEEHQRKATADLIRRAIKSGHTTLQPRQLPGWYDQNDRLFALEQRVDRIEQALKEKSEREELQSDRNRDAG